MFETRLPSWPRSSASRMLTGHMARSSSPFVSWPRARRYRPRPPASTVSTTSFTVPPRADLTARVVGKENWAQANPRSPPTGRLKTVRGAGVALTGRVAELAEIISRVRCAMTSGRRASKAASVQVRLSSPRRCCVASWRRLKGSGSGCGAQASAGGSGSSSVGETSLSTMVRSTPETPSTIAWWIFQTTAVCPGMPRSTIPFHNGRLRSSMPL